MSHSDDDKNRSPEATREVAGKEGSKYPMDPITPRREVIKIGLGQDGGSVEWFTLPKSWTHGRLEVYREGRLVFKASFGE